MGDVGATHLAQLIGINHTLQELLLSDNDLTPVSGRQFLRVLEYMPRKQIVLSKQKERQRDDVNVNVNVCGGMDVACLLWMHVFFTCHVLSCHDTCHAITHSHFTFRFV